MKTVFVIGSGAMGSGIAQNCLTAGYKVILRDISEVQLSKAAQGIEKSLARQVSKERMTSADKDAALARLTTTTSLLQVSEADMIIEAASEKKDIKKAIFAEICKLCRQDAILTTNTSSISITEIAGVVSNPSRFIGTHFFNPVPVMKLLEVVRGLTTSDETVSIAVAFGKTLGKEIIVSKDNPAFIVNRMLDPMINEAISLLEAGIGSVDDIDRGMRFGLNHPMGPLELIDMAGIDIELAVMEVLLAETGDPKYRPSNLLKNMVRANLLGKKTGKGFYIYHEDGSKEPNPELLGYLK
ncbi:3-hydroxyacyl-CoA dehydrogenase NAD-binding domain-containing protein [Clostridium aminobutyricum]|uniref:3-hydroxybutyryl-CoA dehydrogenase n=1 Tax=Clostridium aminobutyricum TaxID=33953 RepID=A0A939DAA1_CLOAM|nr:3-hydroxybutyryl-CoA dehydrogenase [Clostridium aminobutyricum]